MHTEQPLFFYLLYTSSASFLVIMVLSVFLKEPRIRAKLFTIPLIIPFASYIVNHLVFKKECIITYTFWYEHFLCTLESRLLPYIITAIIIALTITCYFIVKRVIEYRKWLLLTHFHLNNEQYNQLVRRICSELGYDKFHFVILDIKRPVCAVFGYKKQFIIMSRLLLVELNYDELKAIIAHEIAHIQRKDHLWGWCFLLFKDLLIISPLAFWSYRLYRREVERDCDEKARQTMGEGISLASALIKYSKMNQQTGKKVSIFSVPALYSEYLLEYRVKSLLSNSNKKGNYDMAWVLLILIILFVWFGILC